MTFDLQVNGYAGIDFNSDHLTHDEIASACRALQKDGLHGILATIITAPVEVMERRVLAILRAREANAHVAQMIRGVHLEGPFINPSPGFVGAHPASAACRAERPIIDRLLDAAEGQIKLWTMAPEMDDDFAMTHYLSQQGVVVAAGHSDATLEQLTASIDAGTKLFTHLGNGCPSSLPRHDNIIQRVLYLADRISISLIADGHHLPRFVLSNLLRSIPDDKIIIVSDAIAAAGLGPGKYRLADQWVEVDADLSTWGEGRRNFAGCATTLPQMKRILCDDLGITPQRFAQWTEHNPSRLVALYGEGL